MRLDSVIPIRHDRRYKKGNVVKKDGVLRGHPDTMRMIPLDRASGQPLINPPLVVSAELANALQREFNA